MSTERALLAPQSLTSIGLFRCLVERSCMSNNDEFSFYTNEARELGSHVDEIAGSYFDPKNRVVLCRPVFAEEQGLDPTYRGETYLEDVSELTSFLDAYFRMKARFQWDIEHCENPNPSEILAHYVAYNYYDCMSGGMPLWQLSIARVLARDQRVNLDEPVYPTKDEKWSTLRDFLTETDSNKVYDEMIFSLVPQLPRLLGPESKLRGGELIDD